MNRSQTKFVVREVTSFCVGATVVMVIKQNTRPKNKLQKAELIIGTTALTLMITDDIGRYTDKWVDDIANAFNRQEAPIVLVH